MRLTKKPPPSDFLIAFPALLQAISKRVFRALLALASSVAELARDVVAAIYDFFVRTAKLAWRFYCRLELSIVRAVAFFLVTAWSVRLLVFIFAPAVLLMIFGLWFWAAIYFAICLFALWLFYTANAKDVEREVEDLAPISALLNKTLRWVLRATLLTLTFVSAAMFVTPSTTGMTSQIKEQWSRILSQISDSLSGSHGASTGPHDTSAASPINQSLSTSVRRQVPPQVSANFPLATVSDTPSESDVAVQPFTIDIGDVYAANLPSITETLSIARAGQSEEIEVSAKAAARSYDFAPAIPYISRDRKTARPLNDEAKAMFASVGPDQGAARYREIVAIQRRAFAADPADIEIAGNLAIYLLSAGDPESAYKYAIYAMSLPRSQESKGRTADWTTIAAALAALGNHNGSVSALFVTLAISTDLKKRCEAAIHATLNTYGVVLREATAVMFQRVHERQLSDAPECGLPIDWSQTRSRDTIPASLNSKFAQ